MAHPCNRGGACDSFPLCEWMWRGKDLGRQREHHGHTLWLHRLNRRAPGLARFTPSAIEPPLAGRCALLQRPLSLRARIMPPKAPGQRLRNVFDVLAPLAWRHGQRRRAATGPCGHWQGGRLNSCLHTTVRLRLPYVRRWQ